MLLCFSGCGKKSPLESSHLEVLPDAIPYDALGSGRIVFSRLFGDIDYVVYVIDVDNATSWLIDRRNKAFHDLCAPAVSPDGTQIIYQSFVDLNTAYDIFIMNIDGTDPVNISTLYGQDYRPSWLPSGQQILFSQFYGGLYRQSPVADPTDRVRLFEFTFPDQPSIRPTNPFSISNSGQIVFSAGRWIIDRVNYYIYRMDMVGDSCENFTELLTHEYSGDQSPFRLNSPVWSPDGQQIAYLESIVENTTLDNTTYATWSQIHVMVMNADGSDIKQLISMEASGERVDVREWENALAVCWSPDGTKLLFNRPQGDRESHLYLIKADGSGLTQVTHLDDVCDMSVTWGY